MNGKENIINKILADADAKSKSIAEDAVKRAEALTAEAQAFAESERNALEGKIDVMRREKAANRLATAELDARKYVLRKKQDLIDLCYGKAYESLKKLSGKARSAFLENLIKEYAEEEETVIVSKADKELVTQKFLDGIGKKLKLSKDTHNGDGGIILVGEGYEKDLTLKRVVTYMRERTESKVAFALFGE